MATVTVSMPYDGGCATTVRRAVDAVLAQTHTDLRLIVVNDGDTAHPPWPALADITDPRLTRFDMPGNRGRYHCDAVTFAATDAATSPWWTVHDADDAAEPTWLAAMLAAAVEHRVDAVLTAQTVHGLSGRPVYTRVKDWTGPVTDHMTHHAHMAGLWSVPWLRLVVGPHPGYRIGWDTIMTGLPFLVGRVAVLDEPLYNRHRRRGSLTISPDTGIRSVARRAVMARIAALWPRLVAVADGGPSAVGRVIEADVDADAWALVQADLDVLRKVIADRPVVEVTAPAPARHAVDLAADPALWTGWALDRGTAAELDARLAELRPKVVVEAGSGSSTLILARYAAATGAKVVSLEHQEPYLRRTQAALDRHFPGGHRVDLRLAPLVDRAGHPWYDTPLPDDIDFALVDGPPEGQGGRAAALPALWPHLADGWEVWLDDGTRDGERAAVTAWETTYGVHVDALPGAKRPLRITRAPVTRSTVDATGVTVTVLTGARPHLLTQTLTALRTAAPGLLESARVIVLRNGDDTGTRDVLHANRDVIDETITPGVALLPLGEATSLLADAAHRSAQPYWLHLEDDWVARTTSDTWLADAKTVLDSTPWVSQVRLRHFGQATLTYHMVTRQPLVWAPSGTAVLSREAHWTCNPAVVRCADIPQVWPAPTESRAQRRAHVAGLRGIAQLVPGVFVHVGDGTESLRAKTGSH